MKLIQLLAAGAAVAVVPAVAGLVGNPSFSQSVRCPQPSAPPPPRPRRPRSRQRRARTTPTTTTVVGTARPLPLTTARTTTPTTTTVRHRARGSDDGPNHDVERRPRRAVTAAARRPRRADDARLGWVTGPTTDAPVRHDEQGWTGRVGACRTSPSLPAHRRELFQARLDRWRPDLEAALAPLFDDHEAVARPARRDRGGRPSRRGPRSCTRST